EYRGEDHDRQDEVRDRARRHHRRAGSQRLLLEAALAVLRRQVLKRLAAACARDVLIVDKLHVASERNPAQLPAGAMPVGEPCDFRPEADRERLDADPTPASDEEM